MPHLHCPQLDILSNRLIEAYRQMTGTDISSVWSGGPAALSVAQLQAAIREHRITCILCQSIQRATPARPFPLPHSA
jgi:hypothetical protein